MLFNRYSKLKYVLPLAQIAIALTLLAWHYQWTRQMMRSDMPGPSPAFTFLTAINFPVAILRLLYSHYLFSRWDPTMFVLSIGLLWYWVSLNILSWRESRSVYTFSWPPLRILGDILLAGFGAIWIFEFFWKERTYTYMGSPSRWAATIMALAWCVILVFFFGRDLIQHIRRRGGRAISESDCQP
jgi:hypothetical protein